MEATSLAELGLEAVANGVRDAMRDAEAVVTIRRRTEDAVATLDPKGELREEVLRARARELRKAAEKQAAEYLADKKTHATLEELLAEEPHWAPELILSRARFTVARGTPDDVSREAMARLAVDAVLTKAGPEELRLMLHDYIRRSWWGPAGAVVREARHRARRAGSAMTEDHTIATELGERLAKAFEPMTTKSRDLFAKARAALVTIENEFRLIGRHVA